MVVMDGMDVVDAISGRHRYPGRQEGRIRQRERRKDKQASERRNHALSFVAILMLRQTIGCCANLPAMKESFSVLFD
jgi:hypothetical protein